MRVISTADLNLWHDYVNWMPSEVQDIHFLPQMMLPYEVTGRGRGGLLIDEDDNGRMIMPLLKVNGELHHPHNFGGPVATPEYAKEAALTGPMYCTLNPFIADKQQPLLAVVKYIKESVWVDLKQPIKYRQTTRHAVDRAKNKGAEFAIVGGERAIQTFAKMYQTAMQRLNASEHWQFDVDWFRSFFGSLGQNALLGMVTLNGEPECGCILLHGYGTCYYHLAASFNRHPSAGLNHFMVDQAIEVAKNLNCKRIHLGGGVEHRDGLFTFKSGFSDLTLPVYRYLPELMREVGLCDVQ